MPQAAISLKRFTYGDYRRWPEDERWELIEGIAFDMCPAPTRQHQALVVELVAQIAPHLRDEPCAVYVAPFDVRLPEYEEPDDEVETVVQPDLAIICDPDKLDDKGCRGAPDWIIEVLSPGTAIKDQTQKLALYERHGVREYWLIHPVDRVLTIYRLEDRIYGRPEVLALTGATATIVPGLSIHWPQATSAERTD